MLSPAALRKCAAACRPLNAYIYGARSISSNHHVFAENDIVFLRQTTRQLRKPEQTYLSQPLSVGKTIPTHIGDIPHAEIIGRQVRDVVSASAGRGKFWITFPTLEEYLNKSKRLVTPVYPLDAATIVSLLDIHVTTPSPSTPTLEIFEAGTGHGSLTLHLCRAIHGANTHLLSPTNSGGARGALLHTIDNVPKHSIHAQKLVHNFRRGLYSSDVEFHVGDPTTWISTQLESRSGSSQPFLTHALLDLPAPQEHLSALATALHPNGILGVWCPSISQHFACVQEIREAQLPLAMDKVLEFPAGSGVGAGLRRWDVRYTNVRARADGGGEEKMEMVCRPMVGEVVVGGGFFAIFRKTNVVRGSIGVVEKGEASIIEQKDTEQEDTPTVNQQHPEPEYEKEVVKNKAPIPPQDPQPTPTEPPTAPQNSETDPENPNPQEPAAMQDPAATIEQKDPDPDQEQDCNGQTAETSEPQEPAQRPTT